MGATTTSIGSRGLVAARIEARHPALLRAALAAGLAAARPRSAKDRLVTEAGRYLALLSRILRKGPAIRGALRHEVESGAFAAATIEQAREVFAVWRLALRSLEGGQALQHGLSELETMTERSIREKGDQRIDVVALAASAGGIPALRGVLSDLGEELPATVLIVLHLAPDSPTVLASVLDRETRLPVEEAIEGAPLRLGHVYVALPGHHLEVDDGRMHLRRGPLEHRLRPAADVLFRSAAKTFGARFASVVLSGSGSDGAAGTLAVRAQGGVTFAQTPATAEFRSMPESAVATGAVQHVASLPRIARLLSLYALRGRNARLH